MAMGMPSGDGVPFYDPFYEAKTAGSIFSNEGSRSRYSDDFNVFNCVHISKPQILSLNIPMRSSLELRPLPSNNVAPVTNSRGAALLSTTAVVAKSVQGEQMTSLASSTANVANKMSSV